MSSFTVTQLDKAGIVFDLDGTSAMNADEKITLVANNSVVASGQHTERWTQVVDGTTDKYEITVPNLALFSSETLIVRISGPGMNALTQTLSAKNLPPTPTVVAASGNNAIYLTVTNVGELAMVNANTMITLQSAGEYLTYTAADAAVAVSGNPSDGYVLKVTGLTNDVEYEAAVSYANSIGEGPFSTTVTASASAAPQAVTSVDYDSSGNIVSIVVPEIDVSGNGMTALSLKLTNGVTISTVTLFPSEVALVAGKLESATYTVQSALAAGATETVQAYLVASYSGLPNVQAHASNWLSTVCDNDTLAMSVQFDLSGVDILTGTQVFTVTVNAQDASNNAAPGLTISAVDASGNNAVSLAGSDTTWIGNEIKTTLTIAEGSSAFAKYLKAEFTRANRDEINTRTETVTLAEPLVKYHHSIPSISFTNGKPLTNAAAYKVSDTAIVTDLSNGEYTVRIEVDGRTQQVDASGNAQIAAPAGGWVEGDVYYPKYIVTKTILNADISQLYAGKVSAAATDLDAVELTKFIFAIGSKVETVTFVPTVTRDADLEVTAVEFKKVLLSGDNNGATKTSIRMLFADNEDGTLSDISFGENDAGFDAMNGELTTTFSEVSFDLPKNLNVTDDALGNVVFVSIQDDTGTLDDIKVVTQLDESALNIHNLKRAALAANVALGANASLITSISGEVAPLNSTLGTRTQEYDDASANKIAADEAYALALQGVVDASGEVDVVIQNRRDLDFDINLYSTLDANLTNHYNDLNGNGSSAVVVEDARLAMVGFPEAWGNTAESPLQATRLARQTLSQMTTDVEAIGSVPGIVDGVYNMAANGTYKTKADELAANKSTVGLQATIVVAKNATFATATQNKSDAEEAVAAKLAELQIETDKTSALTSTRTNAYTAFDAASPAPVV